MEAEAEVVAGVPAEGAEVVVGAPAEGGGGGGAMVADTTTEDGVLRATTATTTIGDMETETTSAGEHDTPRVDRAPRRIKTTPTFLGDDDFQQQ